MEVLPIVLSAFATFASIFNALKNQSLARRLAEQRHAHEKELERLRHESGMERQHADAVAGAQLEMARHILVEASEAATETVKLGVELFQVSWNLPYIGDDEDTERDTARKVFKEGLRRMEALAVSLPADVREEHRLLLDALNRVSRDLPETDDQHAKRLIDELFGSVNDALDQFSKAVAKYRTEQGKWPDLASQYRSSGG
ncbi:MAG: hypothetical protein AAGA56_14660 [Myxococcota bacterium]